MSLNPNEALPQPARDRELDGVVRSPADRLLLRDRAVALIEANQIRLRRHVRVGGRGHGLRRIRELRQIGRPEIDVVDVDARDGVEAVLSGVRDVQDRAERHGICAPMFHCMDEGSGMLVLPHRQCGRRFGLQPRAVEILELPVAQRYVARERRVLDRVVDVRRGRRAIEEEAAAAAHDEFLIARHVPRGAEARRQRQPRIHEVRLGDVLRRESGSRSAVAGARHERADRQLAVRAEELSVTGFIAWRLVPVHVVRRSRSRPRRARAPAARTIPPGRNSPPSGTRRTAAPGARSGGRSRASASSLTFQLSCTIGFVVDRGVSAFGPARQLAVRAERADGRIGEREGRVERIVDLVVRED